MFRKASKLNESYKLNNLINTRSKIIIYITISVIYLLTIFISFSGKLTPHNEVNLSI